VLACKGSMCHPKGERKKVFKLFLKTGKELAVLRSNGKLFQTSGAATEKRCLPNTVLQNGAERRCCVDRRELEGSYRSKVTAR